MATEALTRPADAKTALPKIKTALPGPNAKRIIADDDRLISPAEKSRACCANKIRRSQSSCTPVTRN